MNTYSYLFAMLDVEFLNKFPPDNQFSSLSAYIYMWVFEKQNMATDRLYLRSGTDFFFFFKSHVL